MGGLAAAGCKRTYVELTQVKGQADLSTEAILVKRASSDGVILRQCTEVQSIAGGSDRARNSVSWGQSTTQRACSLMALLLTSRPGNWWRTIIDKTSLNDSVQNDTFQMDSTLSIQDALTLDMCVTSIDFPGFVLPCPNSPEVHEVPLRGTTRRSSSVHLSAHGAEYFGADLLKKAYILICTWMTGYSNVMTSFFSNHKHSWQSNVMTSFFLKSQTQLAVQHYDKFLLRSQTQLAVQLCDLLGLLVNLPKSKLDLYRALCM